VGRGQGHNDPFLLRDAMQTRPMPSCSVCVKFVHPFTFVNSVKTSNRILRFHRPVAKPFYNFLHTKPYGIIPTGTPLTTGASNADRVGKNSRAIAGYRSVTDGVRTTTATLYRAVYRTDGMHQRIFVYNNQHGQPRRREQNIIIRSGKSKAKLTNNRRVRSTHCTIGATDRHEPSRGLSATAELLV